MKIAVCIASMGRPAALLGSMMTLWRLRSEKHEIVFSVGLEKGDRESFEAMDLMDNRETPVEIRWNTGWTRGHAQNAAIQGVDADVYTLLTDRTFCISPGWDENIALSMAIPEYKDRVMWWSCRQDQGPCVPIIPRAYLEALDMKWSPEIFPYWYDDTWHYEIYTMLYGGLYLRVEAEYAGIRSKTRHARDFMFWNDIFRASKSLRIEQAKKIAKHLGIEWVERPEINQDWLRLYDNFEPWVKIYEDTFGDQGPKDQNYITAYCAAQERFQ